MKRFILTAALAALMLVPASALARHGDHKLKHRHGTVGTVTAFDSDTGELTLTTKTGREITALVTDATELECSDDSTARTSRHGDDDDRGDDDDDRGDDDDDDASDCVPAVGDTVRRARIDLGEDDVVWTKLKLA